MEEVEDVIEVILAIDIPDRWRRYSDATWFSVGLKRCGFGEYEDAVLVDEVMIRMSETRHFSSVLRLIRALESRAQALRVPLIAMRAKPELSSILRARKYRQLDPTIGEELQQNWVRLPSH